MAKVLSGAQLAQWHDCGAVWPIDLLSPAEVSVLRNRYEAVDARTEGGAMARFRIKAHLPFPWLWDLIAHPRLLDAIEDVIGPDIVCWGSSFFTKKAHDPGFISWHQDSTYYGLEPPDSVTAWIAFTDATSLSGCMKIVPGTHRGPTVLPHEETRAADNMLSRGQTIRGINDAAAVEMPLRAGQFSIHHNKTVHSSEPNRADWPRIGFAAHYAAASVRQVQFDGATAIHLRGTDPDGNWVEDGRPNSEMSPESMAALDTYLARYRTAMRPQD
ncbi:MAG: phytanoyl-CoA dioxygenase family protein [Rhodospirillaceae bacterium]